MDIKRISPYPDHCTVTLDIPWDVAEALVSAGPSLIASLRDVVNQHKQTIASNEHLNQFRDNKADSAFQKWHAMAEVADIRVRQLMQEENLSFPQAISVTAKENHFPPSSMRALVTVYREKSKEENKHARNVEIIRLYFKGMSDRDIGRKYNIAPRTVQRILAEHKDIIKFTRNKIATKNPEQKQETRKNQKARLLRRNAEILEQHRRGASAYKLAKLFNLSVQTIHKILKTSKTTTSELILDQKINERKENHKRLGVQLYRHYRRIKPSSAEMGKAHKELAEQFSGAYGEGHDLPPNYVAHLVKVRRNEVKAYIYKRRLSTILRLKGKKYKYADIATAMGLREKTVAQILHKHKASQIQGEAS